MSEGLFDRRDLTRLAINQIEHTVRQLPAVGLGKCSDCKHDGHLRRYATLELCSGCAARRLAAGHDVLEPDEYAKLVERLCGG